jgi:hypothetical protein
MAAGIIADQPAPTHNRRALGHRTARIYRIFEARIVDIALARAILLNYQSL